MAVKSPGAILRSSFRPEKVFFDQVSGVWSPAADFRIECRSPPRRNRRENGGGRFFDRMAGLGGRGRPRPLKQPSGGLSWRRSAVVARQRRPRLGGAPQPSADAQHLVVGAAQNALGQAASSRRRDSRRWPATPQAQPRHPRRRSTDPRRAPAQAGPPKRRSDVSAGHRAAPAAAGGATGAPTAPRQRPEPLQATERR